MDIGGRGIGMSRPVSAAAAAGRPACRASGAD